MTQQHNPDKAMAAMLKRKSAWPAATGDCPDAATLAAYFERLLTPAETSRWESHFSSCARCQEQLAALVRAEFPTQAKPAEARTPILAWLWNWRFLAPVGAAAVLLIAFVISQQMMRAPERSARELMAKRDVAAPAPPEPQKLPAATAGQDLEKGKAAADELREDKALAARTGARANLPAKPVPAEKSANVASEKYPVAAPPQPAGAGGRFAAAPAQAPAAQQAAPVTVVTAPAETAKLQQQAAQENRAQAAPAPSAVQQAVTVEAIQKQERDAKIAESKALADRAAPVADLKREAAEKKEGAATGRAAPSRSRSGVVGGVSGAVVGGVAPMQLRAAPGEFAVVTPDSKTLWRFHPSGLIERSTDSGKTWTQQKSPTHEVLLTGSAPSGKICWAGGKNGVLLRTTDAGDTWEIILSPTQSDIILVKALDHLRVTITDSDGRSYETPNAGRLWRTP